MKIDISVKIGGEAGQGIQTVGHLLALVCRQAGLYVMAVNDFESRIRGGHSFFQIRICDRPVAAPHHRIHLLVALNQETYDLHHHQLETGGLAIMEAGNGPAEKVVNLPLAELAQQAGGPLFSNTVAAGACLSLLGAPFDLLKTVLAEQFGRKGSEVLENNYHAADLGYGAVKTVAYPWAFAWPSAGPRGALMDGSKAIALGALAGDCRLAGFYPMSPATGVMVHLSALSDRFPLVVEQAEDEIAAVNMIIGAAFAGVRAMTSTSGGGFCLMTEGLGLAGITETPIVIVDAQRPGPATGLPTRTGQGDLHFVIRASQDEFPRFVFAPGNPAEAFETTARAFHLAEKYQVPAIVLSDQYLADSLFIVAKPLTAPATVERFVVTDADLPEPAAYQRFALTPSGVSPRALPCGGEALVVISSDEHREDGHISEAISDRVAMVDKRNAKLPHMCAEMNPPQGYHADADVLLVSWGSSQGAVAEAVDRLRAEGIVAGCLHCVDLWPFPAAAFEQALGQGRPFYMVEQNAGAQLGQLIREQTGLAYAGTVLKYDGRPFYPQEIVDGIKAYVR